MQACLTMNVLPVQFPLVFRPLGDPRMRLLNRRPLLGAVFVVAAGLLAGCQRGGPAAQGPPPPPKVTVSQAVRQKITPYGEYTGFTEAVQRVEIRPQVTGVLKAVHFNEGTEIKKGTLLYEIDPTEFKAAETKALAAVAKAKADQERAEAEWTKARADLARAEELRKSNAVSDTEYQSMVAAARATQASVSQAEAAGKEATAALETTSIDVGYTVIKAPIDGRISRTLVTPGNLVIKEQTPLVITVLQAPIYVFFDVPEPEAIAYERLAKETGLPLWSAGKIPLELEVETETGYPHKGFINFRDPRFDVASGTVRLRGIFENTEKNLSSGMFARVRFPRGPAQDWLVVPEAAVLSDQRGRFVYVLQPDNTVSARTVTIGQKVGAMLAIAEGITADDWVVVNGVQKAQMAFRQKAPVDPDKKPMEVLSPVAESRPVRKGPGGPAGKPAETPKPAAPTTLSPTKS